MPRIFAITAAKDRIELDASGRGEVVYTVTNSTARPLRGRARVVALESAKQAWFTLAGETERDFGPNATHQYTVQITAPPGTGPGSYRFRLDADSATNPTEDFDEGPAVAVQIPEPRKKQDGRSVPWWVFALAAALVLIVAAVVLYVVLRPDMIPVPDVRGRPQADAIKTLADQQLKGEVSESEVTPTNPPAPGTVIRQKPEPGTEVEAGAAVSLVVEAEPVKIPVPPVVGALLINAIQRIVAAKLVVDAPLQQAVADPNRFDKVISQSPAAGAMVDVGASVIVTVGVRRRRPWTEILTTNQFADIQRLSPKMVEILKRPPQ